MGTCYFTATRRSKKSYSHIRKARNHRKMLKLTAFLTLVTLVSAGWDWPCWKPCGKRDEPGELQDIENDDDPVKEFLNYQADESMFEWSKVPATFDQAKAACDCQCQAMICVEHAKTHNDALSCGKALTVCKACRDEKCYKEADSCYTNKNTEEGRNSCLGDWYRCCAAKARR